MSSDNGCQSHIVCKAINVYTANKIATLRKITCASCGLFTGPGPGWYRKQDWHNRKQWVLAPVNISTYIRTHWSWSLSLSHSQSRSRTVWIYHYFVWYGENEWNNSKVNVQMSNDQSGENEWKYVKMHIKGQGRKNSLYIQYTTEFTSGETTYPDLLILKGYEISVEINSGVKCKYNWISTLVSQHKIRQDKFNLRRFSTFVNHSVLITCLCDNCLQGYSSLSSVNSGQIHCHNGGFLSRCFSVAESFAFKALYLVWRKVKPEEIMWE